MKFGRPIGILIHPSGLFLLPASTVSPTLTFFISAAHASSGTVHVGLKITLSALRKPVGSGKSGTPVPTLYVLINEPSAKMSMRCAGMLTTTRVSAGMAFGPGIISGLGCAVATAFVASGDAPGDAAGVAAGRLEEVEFRLLGSTVQPSSNTDKRTTSTDRFIL